MKTMEATGTKALSSDEQVRLGELEHTIERGKAAFLDVGQALAEIQTSKLYRGVHETFAEYVETKWGMSKSRAYQFIEAADVSAELSTSPVSKILDKPPSEDAVRALAKAPEGTRAKVLADAAKAAKAEGKPSPTAKDVKAAVKRASAPREQSSKDDGTESSDGADPVGSRVANKKAETSADVDHAAQWAAANTLNDQITSKLAEAMALIGTIDKLPPEQAIYFGWCDTKAWRKAIRGHVNEFERYRIHGLGTSKLSKNEKRPFIYDFEAKAKK